MAPARRDPPQPEGTREGSIEVRAARPGEEVAVAEVHVRSWQEAYRGLMPEKFLAGLDPRVRAGRYDFGGDGGGPATLVAVAVAVERCGEGPGDDPSLTNREVRPGSSPGPIEPILGFVTFGASRDADAGGLGEVYALYVDPESYLGGLGRTLMKAARGALQEQGFEAAILWVLDGNDRAARFYEREGWARDGARREENVYDIASNVTRFRRPLP